MKKRSVLESHVGFWLRFVSNHVSLAFAKRLSQQGVGVGEWVVLNLLNDQIFLSSAKIAEAVGMTRGATSKMLDKMFCKGLIFRQESNQDRRYQEISISPAGKELLPKLIQEAESNEEYFFGHLSNKQKHELIKLLEEVVCGKNLNKLPID